MDMKNEEKVFLAVWTARGALEGITTPEAKSLAKSLDRVMLVHAMGNRHWQTTGDGKSTVKFLLAQVPGVLAASGTQS
jgi:hypothetical protein